MNTLSESISYLRRVACSSNDDHGHCPLEHGEYHYLSTGGSHRPRYARALRGGEVFEVDGEYPYLSNSPTF